MKKIALLLCVCIIFVMITSVFTVSAYTPTFDVNAKSALLMNTDTGEVLLSKNVDKRIYPASLSYLMNALIVVENTNPDDVVTVKKEVVNKLLGTGAIVAQLKDGEEMTVSDLLRCMLMASHNDAALVLADYIAGSSEDFVKLMNGKARELGMKNTNYATPVGLFNDKQYTTVNDMLKLYVKVMENELVSKILSQTRYTVPETNKSSSRILANTTWLLDRTTNYYYKHAVAGKTGNSDVSGRCLAVTAENDSRNYVCILAECDNKADTRLDFADAKNLFSWAFNNFEYKTVVSKGEQVPISVNVDLSWEIDNITLISGESIVALLPKDADLSTIEYIPDIKKSKVFDAPIKQGQQLGTAKVYFSNPSTDESEPIGEITLLAGQEVECSWVLLIWRWTKNVIYNPFVILAVVALIVTLIVMTIVANVKAKREHRKKLRLKKRL